MTGPTNSRLYRSPTDRVLAGVAGGMAETYGWDPAVVRIIWTLLILLTGGTLLLLYIVMALVIPLRANGLPPGYAAPGYMPEGSAPPPPPDYAGPAVGTDAASFADTEGQGVSTHASGNAPATDGWNAWRYPPGASATPGQRRSSDLGGGLIIGVLLVLVGAFFLAREFFPVLQIGRFWPVLLIGLGVLLLLGAFVRRSR